ncbi:MAG: electron transport complex subunit RsxC [Candidatus Fermentibacteria bacterium]|nr:electron transport complex subunit RsxC [Candidatus Fermentibacteria bacterium]
MSKVKSFAGGTHPPGNKSLSSGAAVVRLPAPEVVTVPLCQHLGAPSKPVVKPGDEVKRGSVIGEQNGFISLPTHSPVNGKVLRIENSPMPHMRSGPAVVIRTDSEEGGEVYKPVSDWKNADNSTIINRIKEAGICGMGGASFPTYVKLSPPKGVKIDTLIINGVECEPYLTADHRLMLERADDLITGMNIIAGVLGVDDPCIGIEVNKPDAIKLLQEKGARVVPLKVQYPQGAEKQLIDAVAGRTVPAGGLPLNIGVVVQNVGTCVAVTDAVCRGIPCMRRTVTVSGLGVNSPGNFDVCVGTPVSTLIEAAGGYKEDVVRLISGGPMMGIAMFTDAAPVTKGTSGILAMSSKEVRDVQEGPCIRCGRCVDVCPLNLLPSVIATASEYAKWEDAEKSGALNCMACGTCSYVCPAGRYLVHHIKRAQNEVRALVRAREA